MPSFDVVCEADMVEVKNAVEQSNKEITTRFDFKGSSAKVEQKEKELTLFADSDFQLGQVKDVLINKMTKRKVDVRFLDAQTGMWTESWDTIQITGQPNRLPLEVKITLTMKAVPGAPAKTYTTKFMLPMQQPLSFGISQ